jgi:death on curing protein
VTDYLDLDDVLTAAVAAIAPAEVRIRDIGLLESAIARPQASVFGQDAYPDLHTNAAALLESLARNHALIDGNKRLAWTAMRLFLGLNGDDVRAPSPGAGDDFVRAVAQGNLELGEIAARLIEWRPR